MTSTIERRFDTPTAADRPTGRQAAAASAKPGRLIGIDLARALALLGMFTQHVRLDGDGGESSGWVAFVFAEAAGRASVLFFVLSGVSLSIIAQRGSASAAPAALYRRGFLLLTGGILLTTSVWSASILQHYGLAFLAAPLLLRLGKRGLVVASAAGLIGGPILLLFAPNWSGEVTGLWGGSAGDWVIDNLWDIAVSGIYPMVLWIGFFTLGMLIGRLDLGQRRNLVTLAVGGLLAAVIVGLTASQLTDRYGVADDGFDPGSELEAGSQFEAGAGSELGAGSVVGDTITFKDSGGDFWDAEDFEQKDIYIEPDWRRTLDVSGHSGGMGWTLQTGSMAVAVMALALMLPAAVTGLLKPLAWTGSMSLTAYLVHIVLVTDVFDPFVEPKDWSILTKELLFAGLLLTMVTVCSIFQLLFRVGPLEWLLKQFTVGRVAKPAS